MLNLRQAPQRTLANKRERDPYADPLFSIAGRLIRRLPHVRGCPET